MHSKNPKPKAPSLKPKTQSLKPKAVLIAVLLFSVGGSLRAGETIVPYAGAEKCRFCHFIESKGGQYPKWLAEDHHKAYAVLASEKAKKIAKERSVVDPQRDKACLSCHVTAYDVPADQKDDKLELAQGVQCESCHGPGGRHSARRLEQLENESLTLILIPRGEVVAMPSARTCQRCHNESSPTYKPLSFPEDLKKISHLDPRKNYPADYLDKLGAKGQTKAEERK